MPRRRLVDGAFDVLGEGSIVAVEVLDQRVHDPRYPVDAPAVLARIVRRARRRRDRFPARPQIRRRGHLRDDAGPSFARHPVAAAARLPQHQLRFERRARGRLLGPHQHEQVRECRLHHVVDGLRDGGERALRKARYRRVVEADEQRVLRDADACLRQDVEGSERHGVVCRHDRIERDAAREDFVHRPASARNGEVPGRYQAFVHLHSMSLHDAAISSHALDGLFVVRRPRDVGDLLSLVVPDQVFDRNRLGGQIVELDGRVTGDRQPDAHDRQAAHAPAQGRHSLQAGEIREDAGEQEHAVRVLGRDPVVDRVLDAFARVIVHQLAAHHDEHADVSPARDPLDRRAVRRLIRAEDVVDQERDALARRHHRIYVRCGKR